MHPQAGIADQGLRVFQVQLGADAVAVGAHRLDADVQLLGDVVERLTAADAAEDVQLAVGEAIGGPLLVML
jgi:hypothetical protein